MGVVVSGVLAIYAGMCAPAELVIIIIITSVLANSLGISLRNREQYCLQGTEGVGYGAASVNPIKDFHYHREQVKRRRRWTELALQQRSGPRRLNRLKFASSIA